MAQSEKLKSTKGVQLELASLKMLVSPQAKYLRGLGHICVPFRVSRSSILTVGFVPLLYLREHLPHSKELSLSLVVAKMFFCINTLLSIFLPSYQWMASSPRSQEIPSVQVATRLSPCQSSECVDRC